MDNLRQISDLTLLEKDEDSIMWALQDVSFEVKEGEVLGIIGHNGAGKSTLLKILSRITEPSEGEVLIRGRVAALLEVGTGFHPELTGRENIYMNGTILGMRKKEVDQKLEEIVAFSGVEKYLDTPVKFYSSGMRVRLGFSVAAHLEPEILIIDEVLSVGDAEFQKKCLGKMEDVSRNGRTVLFVSHNMTAVQNLCDNGILLNGGKLILEDKVENVVHAYLSANRSSKLSWISSGASYLENDDIKFISATILNQELIYSDEKIDIEFEFEYKKKDTPLLDVTFHLRDELNNLIFSGTSAFDLNVRPNGRPLKFRCCILDRLLLEGNYSVSKLMILRDKGHVIFTLNELLSFQIISAKENKLGWMGKRKGLINAPLKWS